MLNKTLITCLLFLFTSVALTAQQTKKKPKLKELPLMFLDGRALSPGEIQTIDPEEIASLTVLKEEYALKHYGRIGVVLINSKRATREEYQKYFSSRSPEYQKLLAETQGSDETFTYILDEEILKKNYETDLASIADSTFKSIKVVDSLTLANTYKVTNKSAGIVITTTKGPKPQSSTSIKYKFEPQLLILSPGNTAFDPQAAKDIEAQNKELRASAASLPEGLKEEAENIQLMRRSATSFISKLDFFKQVTMISQDYLAYRFFERFPQTLILVKDQKIDANITLAQFADAEKMPYLLLFPSVNITKGKTGYIARIKAQLYERESNSLLIDKEYQGDDQNPGFEFMCKEGSLNCTLNNALSTLLREVIQAIAMNNATLKAEKLLRRERSTFIRENIYPESFDVSLLRKAVPLTDKSINLENVYQCLNSPKADKFVAFFTKIASEKTFKDVADGKKDRNVNIISKENIPDKALFNEIPNTYAYIVKGVKSNGRWFYKKDKVTYFEPEDNQQGKLEYLYNLQKWGYFKKESTEPDTGFWHGQLFERVPDLRKDPKWENYREMWRTEEKENRDYIGMYEIVASVLRSEKEEQEKAWQDSVQNHIFAPFYQQQIRSGVNGIKAHSPVLTSSLLIYSKNKKYILNPEEVKDANGSTYVRYFLFESATGKIYEWTYFSPYQKKKGNVENGIMDNLNKITQWNYSYDTLDDDSFWSNCVLLKENGMYKYLREVN
ncbi:MAG: hypothetical protein ACO1NU_02950 [Arcticibacter sp.]